ncbi:MAG: hypothetical protein AAGD14_03290 [Planctomycetota bacterium]
MGTGKRLTLCLLLGLLTACGAAYGPGATPRDTLRNYEGAMRDLEFGCLYDMMAPSARAQIDGQIEAAQMALSAIPPDFQKKFGLDDFVDASPREALDITAAQMRDRDQDDKFKKMSLAILEVREYGDTASVKVSVIDGRRDSERRIKMVRTDGLWYLASDIAMGPIAPIMPTMPAPRFT